MWREGEGKPALAAGIGGFAGNSGQTDEAESGRQTREAADAVVSRLGGAEMSIGRGVTLR